MNFFLLLALPALFNGGIDTADIKDPPKSQCVIYIEQRKTTLIEPDKVTKKDIQYIETVCPREENPENNPLEGSKL